MSIAPTAPHIVAVAEESFSGLWERVTGLFGGQGFAPRVPLDQTPGIDPRFLPRVPMHSENIDVGLLAGLSKQGFKHGLEITEQTHPEVFLAWKTLCKRAGIENVPQLILVEDEQVNAAVVPGENVGIVTTGAFKHLNFREVFAVFGHEMGHKTANHSRPRILANSVLITGGVLAGDSIAHKGGIGSFIVPKLKADAWPKKVVEFLFHTEKKPLSMVGYLEYSLLGAGVGHIIANQSTVHPTELDADRRGAILSGDPEGLASAISKLDAPKSKWTIGRWFRFIVSGYPSTENRIAKLHQIAANMPPGVTPVYQEVESASPVQATTPEAVNLPNPQNPSPQVSAISATERGVSTVEQTPIAAL